MSSPAAADAVEDDLNPFEPAPGQTHFKPRGMVCTQCQHDTVVVAGDVIYPDRPDLFDRFFWLCRDCWRYVGCHAAKKDVDEDGNVSWGRAGAVPLGDVADEKLRGLRSRAHQLFDPIWQGGSKTRSEAYEWLGGFLGVRPSQAHIAMLDEAQCRRLIDALFVAPSEVSAPDIDVATELQLAERFNRNVRGLHRLAKQLADAGVKFQVKNNGHHLIVHTARDIFDVWLATERWASRSTRATQHGVGAMLRAAGAAI
ncbi:zinc-finger-containing protein [Roseateles sp. P5_E4]